MKMDNSGARNKHSELSIFIRCSYVASPENFGFTTFFEVRKSYSIRKSYNLFFRLVLFFMFFLLPPFVTCRLNSSNALFL